MAASVISLIFTCINNNVHNFEDKRRFGWVVSKVRFLFSYQLRTFLMQGLIFGYFRFCRYSFVLGSMHVHLTYRRSVLVLLSVYVKFIHFIP